MCDTIPEKVNDYPLLTVRFIHSKHWFGKGSVSVKVSIVSTLTRLLDRLPNLGFGVDDTNQNTHISQRDIFGVNL